MDLTRKALAVCIALCATPLLAEDRAERIVAAFETWAEARDITTPHIAVGYKGEVRADTGGVVDLASLSKAITAACLKDLVAENVVSWETPVGTYLSFGSAAFGAMTLGQLMTHTSGLWPDSTQGAMPPWRGQGDPVYEGVVRSIADRPVLSPDYRYNNENYAVLATVIRAATGEPYAEACAARVLRPLHVTSVQLSPTFGRFAAWGGWESSPSDYLRFIWSEFGASAPDAGPSADLGGGAQYGAGMVWRRFDGGYNQWHFGALCFEDGPNLFTFTVLFANGWGVVTSADACPQEDWFVTLDGAIVEAVFR